MANVAFSLPAGLPTDPALLTTLLDLLPLGVMYYTPVVDAAGTLTDLALAYLNPAAQRMTQLPAQPGTTYRQQFPTTDDNGAWDFHRRSWLTQDPQQFQFYYDADGFDSYFRVTAQHLGEGLLVVFTDTQDEVRTQAEQALLASQAREQERTRQLAAAQAATERERAQLQALLTQAPVAIGLFEGDELRVSAINPLMADLLGYAPAQLLGHPLFERAPELQNQGFDELMRQVQATQEPYVGREVPATVQRHGGPLDVYLNFVYQPLYDEQGGVTGIINVAVEVTEQVWARQQVDQLNQELEARVRTRTQQLTTQQQELQEVFAQAPVAIAVFRGPEYRVELANDLQLAMWDRTREQVLDRGIFEVLPEMAGQGFEERLNGVLATGTPFVGTDLPARLTRQGVREQIFVSLVYSPLREADGRVSGVVVVVTDTTQQVRARQQVEQLNAELEVRVAERSQQLAQNQALLQQILRQLPAGVATFEGAAHRFSFVNERYQQLAAGRVVLGGTVAELFPEIADQGLLALLDQVYATGQPFLAFDSPARLNDATTGQATQLYLDIVYQPLLDDQQQVSSILAFLLDVTEKVESRQQLNQLNQELEARVQERTRQLSEQQELLGHILGQVPAAVATFSGPEHQFTFFNAQYQQLAQGRAALGLAMAEAIPEATAQGFVALLDQVHQTGQPFVGQALPIELRQPDGTMTPHYFNFVFQPLLGAPDQVPDILAFAVEVTAQVAARRQVEEQGRLFRELYEQAPAAVCILRGPEFVVELANPAILRIWGLTAEESLGKPRLELIPETSRASLRAVLETPYRTGRTHHVQEFPVVLGRTHSGQPDQGYFNFIYQPLLDEHGQALALTCVGIEVTEQVLARQRVEASAQQVRDLVAGVPFPIGLYTGPEFHIALANQAILAGWGKGPAVIGQRFADVLPELAAQGVIAQLQQVWASGEALHLRGQQLDVVMAGQPQTFYYNYSFTPLRDAQGQVYGILNTAADVTDQVVAHQRLEVYAAEVQESEARFRTLADAAPSIVWDLRPDGSVRYVNKFCLAFLGISLEEFVASSWDPYLLPADVAPTHQLLGQAIRERTLFSMEHRLRRHDGQYRWLRTQGGPSYYPNGELYGYVGSAIDITELKHTNEQLTRTNVDLDNFIYTASHDLKAPITNIEGLLLALEHELPEAARPGDVSLMLGMIQGAVERFQRTINNLTDLSRLQKEHSPTNDAVALAPVVEAVRLDLTPLLLQTQGTLRVDIPPGLAVTFAEKNLRSVVYNLLSNAFKYRHPDRRPEVQLRSWLAEGYTVLEVQDNGLGLDLARGQERLFAMFQRLHTHVEGTGIGLYMVKKIVENAGGRIEVASELGQGTTFTVYFPQ